MTNLIPIHQGAIQPMHRSRLVLLLVSLVLALAACGGGAADATDTPPTDAATPITTPGATESASAQPTESAEPTEDAAAANEVSLGDMSFSPGELTVSAGTTVTFTNNSSFPHTVTHGASGRPADDAAFDQPISPDGGVVEITFDEPGTYDITCKLHPSMQMRVVVEG